MSIGVAYATSLPNSLEFVTNDNSISLEFTNGMAVVDYILNDIQYTFESKVIQKDTRFYIFDKTHDVIIRIKQINQEYNFQHDPL